MKKLFILVSVLSFIFSFQAFSQTLYSVTDLDFAQKSIEVAQKSDLAFDIVSSLTTEVGPRSAGSPGDAAAVTWAQTTLKNLGFEHVWAEPVKLNKVWTRGTAQAEMLGNSPQPLAVAALGNSVSTPVGGITSDVVYYENYEALKNDSSDTARGKIVFINGKMERTKEGSGYSRIVSGRVNGAIEAGKRGAVAIIIRSVGTDSNRLPHTGTMRYVANVNAIPAAAISNPDADLLERNFKNNRPVRVHLEMHNTTTAGTLSYNVMAEIRGSEKPEQIVAIGGHLDSWDLGTGAIDDGAGVAITVAALKNILDLSLSEGVKPKRTLRVVLFANEENGSEGAQVYSATHGSEKHQLVAESDVGSGSVFRMRTFADEISRPWLAELGLILAPLGVEMGDNNAGTGADFDEVADSYNFAKVDLEQDATYYFDYHHSANDTLDKIDPKDLRQNVATWSALVWLASQAGVDFAGNTIHF